MDRPQRPRRSADPSGNPNVFDDEYEVEGVDADLDYGVAEAFTPGLHETESSLRTRSRTPTQSTIARRSMSVKEAGERSHQQDRAYRSSIAKETRTSFEILNEGSTGTRTPSIYSEAHSTQHIPLRNRPTSTASSYATFDDRSRSPIPGQNGPSHPYDMFPQAGVARSSSVTTSSTSRPRPSIYTPAQPSHPYALYQQNSLPVDDSDLQIQPAIHIGFPGRGNNFHRQIGPDGEEQDIVGPDGHTEQLPPYSKYPEEGMTKVPITTVTAASPVSPVQTLARQPSAREVSPQSQEDLISPNPPAQPPALHSVASIAPSVAHTASSRSSIASEKAWKDKTWREKRRTRVCGGRIPVWALLLGCSIVLFLIIVLGGVIGGLLTAEKGDKEPPTVTVTSTQSMFDASFIPTPTGVPGLQAGQFFLPLGIPQEQQKACLTSGDQYNAWSCSIPPPPLTVEVALPSSGYAIMKLLPPVAPPLPDGSPPRFNFSYGVQHPKVVPMQRLYWVSDLEDPARGPALHFQTTYDKLVILNQNQFATGKKTKEKRTMGPYGPPPEHLPPPPPGAYDPSPPPPPPGSEPPPPYGGFRHRAEALQTGDQPWFCYWNQTFIEGFIYVQQNSSSGKGASSAAPSSTTSGASPGSSFASASDSHSSAAEQTSTPSASPTRHDDDKLLSSSAQSAYMSAISSHLRRMAAASPSRDYVVPTSTGAMPQFPFVMKLEERRIPGAAQAIQPYCQRMVVPKEGPPIPVVDDDGNPIRIHLVENDPSPQDFSTALSPKKPAASTKTATAIASAHPMKREATELQEFWKREDPPKSCHCLWISPVGP